MKPKPLTPAQARKREAERMALEFRLAGASWDQIADRVPELGKPAAARAAFERALAREAPEGTEDLWRAEMSRLDRLMRSRWSAALANNGDASDRAMGFVLKIMAQRAQLLGFGDPKVIQNITQQVLAVVGPAQPAPRDPARAMSGLPGGLGGFLAQAVRDAQGA